MPSGCFDFVAGKPQQQNYLRKLAERRSAEHRCGCVYGVISVSSILGAGIETAALKANQYGTDKLAGPVAMDHGLVL
ncbi:MAG: hypothetical protein V4772_25935, partial [Pseudomonadota bacterium]